MDGSASLESSIGDPQPDDLQVSHSVNDLAVELAGSLEPARVIELTLRRGLEAVRADRATLSRVSANAVTIEATYGEPHGLTWVGRTYDNDYIRRQPLVQRALEERRPMAGGRLEVASAAVEFRDALAVVHQTAVIPLVHGAEVVGLLVLSRFRDESFSDADMRVLTLFSTVAGLALRNAAMHDEVVTARADAEALGRRMRIAAETAADVAAHVQLDVVMQRLLRRAIDVAGADDGSVARVEGDTLVIEASTGGTLVGSRWPMAPLVTRALDEVRVVEMAAGDYDAPSDRTDVIARYGRFAVAPLVATGEVMGLLLLGRTRPDPFGADDLEALQEVATIAALLLRNARLLARAVTAERARAEYMDLAVHEMRSPLTVITGYASMVLEGAGGQVDDAARRMVATIMEKASDLRGLTERLLAMARLESGTLEAAVEPVDMVLVAGDVAARQRARAQLTGGEITVEPTEVGSAGRALADERLAAHILDNLVNNAITYSRGAPQVRITVERRGGQVVVAVGDRGRGIADAEQTQVFGRFVRGSSSISATSGTGLGLYLSRALAERMGGSLVLASSTPDEGSVFELSLPGV